MKKTSFSLSLSAAAEYPLLLYSALIQYMAFSKFIFHLRAAHCTFLKRNNHLLNKRKYIRAENINIPSQKLPCRILRGILCMLGVYSLSKAALIYILSLFYVGPAQNTSNSLSLPESDMHLYSSASLSLPFHSIPFHYLFTQAWPKTKKMDKKKTSKTSSLSPDELSSSACPIPFFSSKPFLSFHLPLWKAFVSCGDRNDKHFLLYLSYTVNRWEKKSYSSHLCYLFLARSLSCDLRWVETRHKTQQQSNIISCAETIKQLRGIRRIDTFFCCSCLLDAMTAREEVLLALTRDWIQLLNK